MKAGAAKSAADRSALDAVLGEAHRLSMRRFGATVVRALVMALTVVSLFTSMAFAGQSYLFCSMQEREVDACCCAESKARAPEGDVRRAPTCCHMNEHASPGSGVTPVTPPVLDAHAAIATATPVAIVEQAFVPRALLLPEWNGPPLQERRAKLQVFLL